MGVLRFLRINYDIKNRTQKHIKTRFIFCNLLSSSFFCIHSKVEKFFICFVSLFLCVVLTSQLRRVVVHNIKSELCCSKYVYTDSGSAPHTHLHCRSQWTEQWKLLLPSSCHISACQGKSSFEICPHVKRKSLPRWWKFIKQKPISTWKLSNFRFIGDKWRRQAGYPTNTPLTVKDEIDDGLFSLRLGFY